MNRDDSRLDITQDKIKGLSQSSHKLRLCQSGSSSRWLPVCDQQGLVVVAH